MNSKHHSTEPDEIEETLKRARRRLRKAWTVVALTTAVFAASWVWLWASCRAGCSIVERLLVYGVPLVVLGVIVGAWADKRRSDAMPE